MKIRLLLFNIFILFTLFFLPTSVKAEDGNYSCTYSAFSGQTLITAVRVEFNPTSGDLTSVIGVIIEGSQSKEDKFTNYDINWNNSGITNFSGKEYYLRNKYCPRYLFIYGSPVSHSSYWFIATYLDRGATKVHDDFTNINDFKRGNDASFWMEATLSSTSVPIPEVEYGDDCEGIFTQEVLDFIQDIFNIFKIVAPLLVIVLSSFDFIKSIISQDKDSHKKSFNKLVKRIIFAAFIFFLPVLIMFLLNLININYGTCNIT